MCEMPLFLLDSKGQNCGFEGQFLERVLLGSKWVDSYSIQIRLLRFGFDSGSTFLDSLQLYGA